MLDKSAIVVYTLCLQSAHRKTAQFVTIQQSEYFGQRIWRIGLSGKSFTVCWTSFNVFTCCFGADSETSSEEEQSEGIFLVQCQETKVDHSVSLLHINMFTSMHVHVLVQAIIVSLLGNAINQFRKHRSSRMRQSLCMYTLSKIPEFT